MFKTKAKKDEINYIIYTIYINGSIRWWQYNQSN